MRKKISIIIPRYQETELEIFPLLSSINNQVGIYFPDIEVIISNDGNCGEVISDDFLKLFFFDTQQVFLDENKGPGVARQNGIDNAKGDYLMFCDADDVLQNVGVLGALLQGAENDAPDIINTLWLEEFKDQNGKIIYITHENENTWLHGKLIRRQFLVKNNIRFHDTLRVHEDSYFLSIVGSFSERSVFYPFISYVWKYNPNSITRINNAVYSFDSIPEFITACAMSYEIIRQMRPEQLEYKIVQFIIYIYFRLHQTGFLLKENEKYLKASEDSFKKHMNVYWNYWENASEEFKKRVYTEERQTCFINEIEDETIWKWIERLGLGLGLEL